jgi:hypothetical protein
MGHLANFDVIVLFFFLGLFASWIKSDLEIPESVSKFLSIFLLLSLGLKGGYEVRIAENLAGFLPVLSIGLISCLTVPVIFFFALRNTLGIANASALAASYGSVSAVTFVAAQGVLDNEGLNFSGYMVAVMALMEIPAILMGVFLHQKFSGSDSNSNQSLFKSIFAAKSVVLLLGGFVIGLSMNQSSWSGISPVVQGCFKGVLAFFLLDIGFLAQKKLREGWKYKTTAVLVALVSPLLFGSIGLVASHLAGVSQGDQILTAVLVGSASYIAAPAAIRSTILGANPSLYLALPLALTFPMNLLFGIPVYIEISNWLASGL